MSAQIPSTIEPREPRTTVFVMATVYFDSGSAPVKVRNMSRSGGLIEGGVIPPVGSRVRLCRGSLGVTGRVTWAKEGQAGLRFDAQVTVTDWLPRGRAVAPQQIVDEIVQQIKASGAPPAARSSGGITAPAKLCANEITNLREAIESLADDLAKDRDVLSRHAQKLQILDIVSQALGKLAAER